jgi:hypothetical protein
MTMRAVMLLLSALAALPAFAADEHGHDHGAAPAANSNAPHRRPDGSVFLPKPAQRQIGVRTIVAEEQELPRSLELTGKVVMDPNAGGKVQALLAGRITAGPRGLPTSGQAVQRGEVLAYVVPSAGQIERSNQAAQLAELRASRALAERRLARLKELSDTIPRKEIEGAESELASLTGRIAAVEAGLSNRDPLVAPVSGVIASSHVVLGQVVEARELAFDIVDPTRLRVEALAFDTDVANDIAAAYIVLGDTRVPLTFVGSARSLREQALPLSFRAEGAALTRLAVGQPVKVVVQTRTKTKGVRVPSAALMKNPGNQTVVWVKMAPEHYAPRTVTVEPLDGANVNVTSGIKTGDRIATSGASLINQVR